MCWGISVLTSVISQIVSKQRTHSFYISVVIFFSKISFFFFFFYDFPVRLDQLIELKLAKRQLQQKSRKSKNSEQIEREKTKKCIANGQMELATVHAENTIRHHTDYLNNQKLLLDIDKLLECTKNVLNTKNSSKSMQLNEQQLLDIERVKKCVHELLHQSDSSIITSSNVSQEQVFELVRQISAEIFLVEGATVASQQQDEILNRLRQLRR